MTVIDIGVQDLRDDPDLTVGVSNGPVEITVGTSVMGLPGAPGPPGADGADPASFFGDPITVDHLPLGNTPGTVAPGNQAADLIAQIPTIDTDDNSKASFVTIDNVTYLQTANLASLTDVANAVSAIDASAITTGTIDIARLPTGTGTGQLPTGGVIVGTTVGGAAAVPVLTFNNAGQITDATTAPLGTVAVLDVDTDTTLSANSDLRVPSQHAIKTYVDNAVTGLLDFKGSIDASTNPNYPAASKGDAYVVSVAGKVGGASGVSVDVGDMVVATVTNAGGTQASVGTSWDVLEHNLVGALLASHNLSDVTDVTAARSNLGLGNAAVLNTGTGSANVVLGGVIAASSGAQGDAAHTQVFAWNAAGQLTAVTNTAIAIDAAAVTSGTLSVTRGGTGVSNPTAHAVYVGAGSSALASVGVGTSGQLLIGQGAISDPAWTSLTGDVSITNVGATAIAASAVTLAKMANLADQRILGNNTGGAAAPVALTGANVLAMLSAQAGAAFDWGAQNLSNIGTLTVTAATTLASASLGTKTASFDIVDIANATTITMNASSIGLTGIRLAPTATYTTNPGNLQTGYLGLDLAATIQGGTGATDTLTGALFFGARIRDTLKTQDTNSRTITLYDGLDIAPSLSVFSGGALTVTTLNQLSIGSVTVPASATVTTLVGVAVGAPTNNGTLTTWIGVDIPAGVGTTHIGLRNKDQTQLGSSAQFVVNTSGVVSKYNNVSTAGFGIAPICDSQSLQTQAAAIADTGFTNTSTAGTYRISYHLVCTTASGTGTATLNIKFVEQASGASLTASSAAVSMASTGNFTQGVIIINTTSSQPTYGVSIGGTQGAGRYSLYITCERLI